MKTVATQLPRVLPAGLAMLFLVLGNVYGQAGAPPAAAPAPPDFSKVEIKTTKISNNFYTLEGQGGTIGVLAGPEGILMVDDQFAPLSQKIVAAVRQISNSPIRFLVNTHVHPDHTGGNENFGKMGVTIVSRDELRARLAHPVPAANGTPGVPAPAMALPLVTYEGRMTFHMDGEDAELVPIPRAHTDGDTLIFFHNADVIMTGDFFRSVGYPNIDRANGGSLKGMLAGLDQLIQAAGPNTKIVPGHGDIVNKNDVAAHRDMMIAIRDKVDPMVKEGKTLAEIVASKPTANYDAKVPQGTMTSERFIGQLYAELGGK